MAEHVLVDGLGYGRLASVDETRGVATVQMQWGTAHVMKGKVRREVELQIHTFARGSDGRRLRPLRHTFAVSNTVGDVMKFVASEHKTDVADIGEVRLAWQGKELNDPTLSIGEAGVAAPFRLLFVLQKRMSSYGGWIGISSNMEVEDNGLVIVNTGSSDKWRAGRCTELAGTDLSGVYTFEALIQRSPETLNTWKICFGCVSETFQERSDRAWIGSQPQSWSYIAGTGGLCNNSGQSSAYGEPFDEGDVIRMTLDYDKGEIEFFRNDVSQGVAFRNLDCPVYPAVALTGTGSAIRILT